MNGFVEIYNITIDKFKLTLSFQAHRDIISNIIQLKRSGFLLTSSFDNSLKIFKLSNNCKREKLIYLLYLNIIFLRINEVIELTFNNNIILSVNNNIINFPTNKNNLSEDKNNLSDYYYSKYEHQRKYLNNLLEINNDIVVALDDIDKKLFCFRINYQNQLSEDIVLIKIIEIGDFNSQNNLENKLYIQCLKPKYNCILLSDNFNIKIIDIKYLEIVSIFQINKNNRYNYSFVISYHKKWDKLFLFDSKGIYKYNKNIENSLFEIEKEEEKNVNIDNIINLNEVQKLIYSPLNDNKIVVFYRKILMIIDLNKL